MSWTGFSSPEKLRALLDGFIEQLKKGKLNTLKKIEFEFLTTASIHEHAISNGWADDFEIFAARFERLRALMIQNEALDEITITWKSFMESFPEGTFNPGLTKEEQRNIPRDFPDNLKLMLKLCNGQNHSVKGLFETRSGYSKVSRLKLLSFEQILSLKTRLLDTTDLDVFHENMTPFAVDNFDNPDDVLCMESNADSIWLLWVGVSDPFLPADWQYSKMECDSSFMSFIVNQNSIPGMGAKPVSEDSAKPIQSLEQNKPFVLFEHTTPRFNVKIEMSFDKDGNFIMDGCDLGSGVKELLGDSDYEYQITIDKTNTSNLCNRLGVSENQRELLFHKIKSLFGKETGFSEFRVFLDNNKITYRYFSWT